MSIKRRSCVVYKCDSSLRGFRSINGKIIFTYVSSSAWPHYQLTGSEIDLSQIFSDFYAEL